MDDGGRFTNLRHQIEVLSYKSKILKSFFDMIKFLKNLFLKKEISKRGLSGQTGRFQLFIQAALLLLIPLLAVMQFIWLGQLSDAEKIRLKSNLQISAKKFSEDFDTELTKIHSLFRIETDKKDQFADELKRTFKRWQNSTQFTSLIDEIYLMEFSENKGLQLKKYNLDLSEFKESDWPKKLLHIKEFIITNNQMSGALLIPLTHAPLLEETPAILIDC